MNVRKAQRPRSKRRAMSEEQRINRRREVQADYYYRHRKLSPEFVQRQAGYEVFNDTGLKQCNICGEYKPPEGFYPAKTGAYRLTQDCKDCRRSISLENYYRRKERKGN